MRSGSIFSLLASARTRNLFLLVFAGSFFSVSSLRAQIAISMVLNRKGYVRYERVVAKVGFRNYSGRTLAFGSTKALHGSIKFSIIGPDGRRVKPRKDSFNFMAGKILKPGATGEVVLPISDLYNVSKPGSYSLHAVISHPSLPASYKSNQTHFSVFNGIVVWKRSVGVPDVLNEHPGEKVKTRLVSILNFYDGLKKLYALKIEDDQFVYGVRRLQEDVDSAMPAIEIDGLSKVHILIQISAKVFSYFVYDLNCNLITFERYKKDGGVNPRLIRDKTEGTVSVVGGVRAVRGRDFSEENPNPIFNEN